MFDRGPALWAEVTGDLLSPDAAIALQSKAARIAESLKLVRTIGIVRASMKIGMQNLACNMRRLVVLDRGTPAAAERPNPRSGVEIAQIAERMVPEHGEYSDK